MVKNVRVVTGTKPAPVRSVNILTSGDMRNPTWAQGAADDRRFETVHDSGGGVKGLKSCIIPGYSPGAAYVAKADFVRGTYFAGGAPVSDVTTLFAAVGNVGTTFNPAHIIPGSGLATDAPSFIGSFLSDLLDPTGYTLLIDFDSVSNSNSGFGLETGDSSNYNHELDGQGGVGTSPTYLYNDSQQLNASGGKFLDGAHNKIALTITPTAMAISVNGADPFTAAPATPTSYPAIAIANTFGAVLYTRSLTIYRPIDNAALAVLSGL